MILVDTSAWIASFSRHGHERLKEFMSAKVLAGEAATAGIILLELIKGCKSQREAHSLIDRFSVLTFYHVPESFWIDAGFFGLELRSRGVQVPAPDLMIAWIAIKHDLTLLHCDKDFDRIARVSELQVAKY